MDTPDEHTHPVPPKSIVPIFIGGIFLIALFAIAVRVLMAWTPDLPDEDFARGEERAKARETLTADNQKRLEEWAWADQKTGAVQMPITVAMERTIESLNSAQPKAAGPVDPNAAAAATQAPAPSPAPDAAGTPVEGAAASETPASSQPGATPTPAP